MNASGNNDVPTFGVTVVALLAVVLLDVWTALFAGVGEVLITNQRSVMRGLRVSSRGHISIYRLHPEVIAACKDQSATRTKHEMHQQETPSDQAVCTG